MKKLFLMLFISTSLFYYGRVAMAQTLSPLQSNDFHLQVQIPSGWNTVSMTDLEVPYLESTSSDENLHLLVYVSRDSIINADQLLDREVKSFGFVLKGPKQEGVRNGVQIRSAEGTGDMMGEKVRMLILSFTSDARAYFAYLYTDEGLFAANAKLMQNILNSIQPLE